MPGWLIFPCLERACRRGLVRLVCFHREIEHFHPCVVDAHSLMNRNLIITLLALVAAAALFFGYRTYRLSAEHDLAQQRAEAELELARQRQTEQARRMAAILEARRMAELRAQEEMARLEKIRAEQAEAQAALAAAEAEQARLAALLAGKNGAGADAARLAAERARAAAEAEAARLAALKKLQDLDLEKRQIADRAAARLAALKRQEALEAEAARLAAEEDRKKFAVGGYLVRDVKSLYILKPEQPPEAPTTPAKAPPSK